MGGAARLSSLLTFSSLCLLLLGGAVLADCANPSKYETNICDEGFAERRLESRIAATTLFTFRENGGAYATWNPDAFPAALLLFDSTPPTARVILAKQNSSRGANVPSPRDILFLAWMKARYNVATLEAAAPVIDDLLIWPNSPSGAENVFLVAAAKHLENRTNTSRRDAVITLLRTHGLDGWPGEVEQDPWRLADAVTGLFALYAESDNFTVRKLAEMNLDLIFTRFAAGSVDGAWAAPTAGNEPGRADPYRSPPWMGWSYLLFNTAEKPIRFNEPAAPLAGYCPHLVSVAINKERSTVKLYENTTNKSILATSATSTYTLAASQDVVRGGVLHRFDAPGASEPKITFTPRSFIELSSRVSNVSEESRTGSSFLFSERVVLGRIAAENCREPHALIGDVTDVIVSDDKRAALIVHEDTKVLLRFLGPIEATHVTQRYAPRSNKLPSWLRERIVGSFAGFVLFPSGTDPDRGVYSVEILPATYLGTLETLGCPDNPCILANASRNTSLSFSNNKVTYVSNISGSTYEYTLNLSATINGYLAEPSASFRNITEGAFRRLWRDGSTWRFTKPFALNGQDIIPTVILNFSATEWQGLKDVSQSTETLRCEDETVNAQPSSVTVSGLGFLAAALLNISGSDYSLLCGATTTILPLVVSPLPTAAPEACLLLKNNQRFIGFVYDKNFQKTSCNNDDVVPCIIKNLNEYYPFKGGESGTTISQLSNVNICNSALINTIATNNLEHCGEISLKQSAKGLPSYERLHLFANEKYGVLLFSPDRDPLTTGWWHDTIFDWVKALFRPPIIPSSPDMDFDAAFFAERANRRVVGFVNDTRSEILFTNFTNLSSLDQGWRGAGYAQRLSPSPTLFMNYTAALRLSSLEASPLLFTERCGGRPVQYFIECDQPGNIIRSCPGNSLKNIRCGADCLYNYSQCVPTCLDLDDDGYNVSVGGATCGPEDCFDMNPALYSILDGGVLKKCSERGSNSCSARNWSVCPQCVNPGIASDVPCDGKDNNCKDGDVCQEDEEEQFTPASCSESTGQCPVICVVPICEKNCASDGGCTSGCGVSPCLPDPDCSAPSSGTCGGLTPCTAHVDCLVDEACRIFNGAQCCFPLTYCFSPETPILTPSGETAIGRLAVGDEVLAYDEERGENVVARVTAVYPRIHDGAILVVNGRLRVTAEHPFHTARGWLPARELLLGDELRGANGEAILITSMAEEPYRGEVYNLHVEPANTYYAGGLLVHNKIITPPLVDLR